MRAVRYHEYGDPKVLVVEDVPEPHAGPGQVRIRVQAASVNPIDWKVRSGLTKDAMPAHFPVIPGGDAAGIVDEVGDGVGGIHIGDSAFGLGRATTAEFAVLRAWATKPPLWSYEQAAAAGIAGATAVRALAPLGELAGRTVLVEGAAGGVGSAMVQIAVARGARVIGTASQAHHDFLRMLGAMPTTYGPGLVGRVSELAPDGVDIAVDLAGSGSVPDLIEIVGAADKVSSIADFGAGALGVHVIQGDVNAAQSLATVAELGRSGAFTPQVAAVYDLDRAGDAHAQVQSRHVEGKVVIAVTSGAGSAG